MSEVVLTEQLNQAIEAMLATPDAGLAATDPSIAALMGIAQNLRVLPRVEFKARLKNELEREITMSTAKKTKQSADEPSAEQVNPARRTVTPYITVEDVREESEFVTRVFGAAGKIYGLGSAGGFHSEHRIGDSMLMIGGGGKGSSWKGPAMPGSLHLYVEDVDAVYERAM